MARGILALGLLLALGAAPAHAGQHCWGPYTLNSNNYAPSTTGDDVHDWVGDFTTQLAITSGTLTVSVEGQLPGMGNSWVSLGQLTTSSLPQYHGPLNGLRYLVTGCSSCVATISACGTSAE